MCTIVLPHAKRFQLLSATVRYIVVPILLLNMMHRTLSTITYINYCILNSYRVQAVYLTFRSDYTMQVCMTRTRKSSLCKMYSTCFLKVFLRALSTQRVFHNDIMFPSLHRPTYEEYNDSNKIVTKNGDGFLNAKLFSSST